MDAGYERYKCLTNKICSIDVNDIAENRRHMHTHKYTLFIMVMKGNAFQISNGLPKKRKKWKKKRIILPTI